jgi:hypothetical protein
LPSTRAIETRSLPTSLAATPRGFAFYVALPKSSIETRSLPTLARCYPCSFSFYVADPISSIASGPHCKHLPRMTPRFGVGLVIPVLWQPEAVRALQQGKNVVVQAPTGSGKTYIDLNQ